MTLPQVVSVVTQKGGAGKSTMALSLGCHWYLKHQHPVGFIDADPQESLAQAVAGGPLEGLLKGKECREGAILDTSFDIAVRPGLHCAPYAHRALGTFPNGTLRLSPGPFNTEADIDTFLDALSDITASFT